MPANTPLGYPYPLGTDRLMDGDDAIHNLASAVEGKLGVQASGTAVVTVATINTPASVAVTFPVGRFTVAPVVTACAVSNNPGTILAGVGTGPTTTGCTVFGYRSASTGTVNVAWNAVQCP